MFKREMKNQEKQRFSEKESDMLDVFVKIGYKGLFLAFFSCFTTGLAEEYDYNSFRFKPEQKNKCSFKFLNR